jgi:hypothetical protein
VVPACVWVTLWTRTKPCELAKAKSGDVGAYELLKDATNDKGSTHGRSGAGQRWYPEPVTYRDWKSMCCRRRHMVGDHADVRRLRFYAIVEGGPIMENC